MEILELELKHFGKFTDHKVALQPGINIIYGNNESGKTTIHAFIRAMLFGFGSGRGRGTRTDEYHLRQPRENPGFFGGSMRIRENGEVWLIERNFERHTRSVRVWNEARSEEVKDPEAFLQGLLGGMGEAAYCNTVFIPQAHSETDEGLMEELKRFMVNVDTAAEQNTDVAQAVASLRKRRRKAEQKRKEEETRLGAQIGSRQEEADHLKRQLEELRSRERELQQAPMQARERELQESLRASGRTGSRYADTGSRYQGGRTASFRDTSGREGGDGQQGRDGTGSRTYRVILEVLLVIAALLCTAGAAGLHGTAIRIFLGVFAVLFLAAVIPVHFLLGTEGPETEEEPADPDGQLPEDTAWKLSLVREDLRGREQEYRKLNGELEALYRTDEKLERITEEIDALSLAIDRISELSSNIFHESGGDLRRRASGILSGITGGRYAKITFDEEMEVRVQSENRWLYLYEISFGTMQQIYFALRMAAGEMLSEGKNLPLVLDEPFAMYDEERLQKAEDWLAGCGRQVILFTCRKQRMNNII